MGPADYLKIAKEALAKLKQWDEQRAEQALVDAYDHLATIYPDGALQYAEKYQPELDKAWLSTLDDMDSAYKAKDMEAFYDALGAHVDVCYKIFNAYKKDERGF